MITLQNNNDISFDHWIALRNQSIGASEVSPICFGSPYTSNLEIWYQKVTGIKKGIENIRTYTGRKSENIVDQFYPYYDGTEDSVYLNHNVGKILRKIENKNVTGRNSKFPHITATPDRFTTLFPSNKLILTEYKNTQGFILKQWKPGLPLDNVLQVLTQLNVFEMQDGEIFYYIDNRRFELHEMQSSKFKSQWQTILSITNPFWESVLKARTLYNQQCEAKRNFNMKLATELEYAIQQLEPPIQHSTGYLTFINEKYKSRASLGGRDATEAEALLAKRYKDISNKIDKLSKEKLAVEVDLKMAMKDSSILNIAKAGTVSWVQYENRKIFKVNYK